VLLAPIGTVGPTSTASERVHDQVGLKVMHAWTVKKAACPQLSLTDTCCTALVAAASQHRPVAVGCRGACSVYTSCWLESDAGASPALFVSSASGKHIFCPSHCWPHQHWPSLLMIQVPVPQHLKSSVMSISSPLLPQQLPRL